MILKICQEYSEYTGLRHCSISENSGEDFYHTLLNSSFTEAYKKQEQLIVDLDFVDGYASSFLDEAFGNLVFDFTKQEVEKLLKIKSDEEPHWKEMIINKTFNEWEIRRNKNSIPVVTKTHTPWYRLINEKLEENLWITPAV